MAIIALKFVHILRHLGARKTSFICQLQLMRFSHKLSSFLFSALLSLCVWLFWIEKTFQQHLSASVLAKRWEKLAQANFIQATCERESDEIVLEIYDLTHAFVSCFP